MKKTHIEQLIRYYEELMNKDFGNSMSLKISTFTLELVRSIKTITSILPQEAANSTVAEIATYLEYLKTGLKTYKITEEFGKQLFKCKLDIPCDWLPKANEVLCIDLPDWFNGKNTSDWPNQDYPTFFSKPRTVYYKTAYVEQRDTIDSLGYSYRMLRFVFPDYDENGKLLPSSTFVNIDISKDRTIAAALEDENFKNSYEVDKEIIHFVLNCYLYIKSGEPDLRFQKAPPTPTTKKPKKLKRFFNETKDTPLIDIILVGFNHLKNLQYSKDQTIVSGHYVRQRCGENRSEIRLIWRKEHIRRFDQSTTSINF